MAKRSILSLVFCLLQAVIIVNSDGLYSIIAPMDIRSNSKYTVAVSVYDTKNPCTIEVGIAGPSFNAKKDVELQPMSTDVVEFDVPALKDGDYNLTMRGLAGIEFENITQLSYTEYKPMIFIQTDKATYKPGDKVMFRVLFMDENTLPAKLEEKEVTIVVTDGQKNRIKQFTNITTTQGVYTDQLQLSEQPVLGKWNIEVFVDDKDSAIKSFEVDKYVLPKFEVIVDTARDVLLADDVIKVTVRAKYTYGKSVRGKATVKVEPENQYYSALEFQAEKTIDIDGKGHVEFYVNNDLGLKKDASYIPSLKVVAEVGEELTGNRQNSTASVNIHLQRYSFETLTDNTYVPDKAMVYRVAVQNLDGSPVQDRKNPVKITLTEHFNEWRWRSFVNDNMLTILSLPIKLESQLDEHGIATFEFIPKARDFYTVQASYLDTTSDLASLYRKLPNDIERLQLTVLSEKPRLGKDVKIEVKSPEPMKYFVYTVTGRGNILKSGRINVPDDSMTHTFTITPTFQMLPTAIITAHYVREKDNEIVFHEKSIDFQEEFVNSIDISTTPQAKPGEEIELKISTDPESFVGLLGVDQSVLLLKSGNDLSKTEIFNGLKKYQLRSHWTPYSPILGLQNGLITITNAKFGSMIEPFRYESAAFEEADSIDRSDIEVPSPTISLRKEFPDTWLWYYNVAPSQTSPMSGARSGLQFRMGLPFYASTPMASGVALNFDTMHTRKSFAKPVSAPTIQVRKNFAEMWIFDDIPTTSANGDKSVFTLAKKIPDTITSWVITGFSLNPKTGFALTDNPTKIQVFQPFFISTNLPYSVKRGEVIAIPIIIFNYMEKTLDAEVTMDNSDREFEFTEATNEVEDKPVDEIKRSKRVTVPSNTGKSVSFMIRPKQVGSISLKITAVTPLAGDAIQRSLKVEPEGITQYENRAYFINLNNTNEYKEAIDIDIPAEAVPDSEYIEFSVVGDLLGPTIKNIHELVRMPYGCGEQNMVNFVPNILVLKYLETINKVLPSVTEKAKKYLEIGYQRELTYKHDDGSYSAFGKSDKFGSTWLTAYVARSFQQAAGYTDVDQKVLTEALDFLASKQAENGSFPEYGKLFDFSHQNELGLTAFVLLTFFENVDISPKYGNIIAKGVKFIEDNIDAEDDQYALSIAATALQKAKRPAAEKSLAKLQSLAKTENDQRWWSKANEDIKSSENVNWYHKLVPSNDVEITSYVLLALLENEKDLTTVLPIVRWLIAHRNSKGGFSSTQNTVIGLQALIKFAEKAGSGNGEMEIDFAATGGVDEEGSIKVTPENSLVLQTHVLPKRTRNVKMTAHGKGSSMVQLSYRYNVVEKEQKPSFKIPIQIKNYTTLSVLKMDVCTEFVALSDDGTKESNMAVMEISLPSGYTADSDSLSKIEEVDRVQRTETKNSGSTVIVYFDGLETGNAKCIPIEASRTHAVANQKPAPILIYDYYEPTRRATEFYQIKSSLCDICENEDCGEACKKEKEM